MGLKKTLKKGLKIIKKVAPIAAAGYGGYSLLNALGPSEPKTVQGADGTTSMGSTEGYGDQAMSAIGGFLKDNASSIISGGAKMLGGQIQNVSNAQQAQKQMDFQAQQSATAHQRETADLLAAGLNPILSGTGGMGASSAGGAAAQMGNVAGDAVDSYWDTKSKQAGLRKIEAETNATNAQAEYTKSQQRLSDANLNLVAPQMGEIAARTAATRAGQGLTEASAKSAWVKAGLDASMSDWEKARRIAEVFNLGSKAAGELLDGIMQFVPKTPLTRTTRTTKIPGGSQSTTTHGP